MNTFTPKWAVPALALLTLAAATPPASAYIAPQRQSQGTTGTAGTNSGPGRTSTLSGTITAIDPTAGTITVTSAIGTATTVTLTTATVLTGLQTTSAENIAVGDRLDLTGIPVTIQASAITVDHSTAASATPATTTNSTNTTNSATTPATGTAASSTPASKPAPGTLHFSAVVTALSPPTVTLGSGLSLTLAQTSTPIYTERVTFTASQLAVGQTASVSFTSGSTTASRVEVTATGL